MIKGWQHQTSRPPSSHSNGIITLQKLAKSGVTFEQPCTLGLPMITSNSPHHHYSCRLSIEPKHATRWFNIQIATPTGLTSIWMAVLVDSCLYFTAIVKGKSNLVCRCTRNNRYFFGSTLKHSLIILACPSTASKIHTPSRPRPHPALHCTALHYASGLGYTVSTILALKAAHSP